MIKSPIFSLNYHDYLIIFLCNFHEISWVLYVRMSEIHMSHDILIWYSHEINIYVRSQLISHDFFHDLTWDFSVREIIYILPTQAASLVWPDVATESKIECWNRSFGQLWTNIAFNCWTYVFYQDWANILSQSFPICTHWHKFKSGCPIMDAFLILS